MRNFLTYPTTLLSKSPDGIVMAGVFDSSYYKHIAALNLPLLSYDTAPGYSPTISFATWSWWKTPPRPTLSRRP